MSTLLTATILLFLLWPAYALLLRYSDRYALNRFLLLLAMAAVCALPFVSLPSPAPVATQSVRGTVSFLEESVRPTVASFPVERLASADELGVATTMETVAEAPPTITLPLIYGLGVGLMLLVLGVRLLLILALHLRSRPNEDGTYRQLHPGASPGQAFTFGRNLYFSENVTQDSDFQHILAHERVHARQGHTLDILLSEVFLCLFWFHPAAWWLRSQMRANLEYLVDKAVVSGGADRRSYQLALVRQSQGAYGLALALPFSEPTLKSRIARMTGLPEYRVVALLAAVALVFWLGMTLLVVNGTVFENDSPRGQDYLKAAAQPGDPYYAYYQQLLPEKLNSLEVYLDRMITPDEYLQLRAILSKAPGVKLYVYKQPFDDGYSIKVSYGYQEAGIIHRLPLAPEEKRQLMFGVERFAAGAGLSDRFGPTAMELRFDQKIAERGRGAMTFFNTSRQPATSINFFDLAKKPLNGNLRVFVNQREVDLLPPAQSSDLQPATATMNGVDVTTLSVEEWPLVVVEGRITTSPYVRAVEQFGLSIGSAKNQLFHRETRQETGSFRDFYETCNLPDNRSTILRYNEHRVSLDFLLDTEFGPDAIFHVAYLKDVTGDILIQVVDDYKAADGITPLNDPQSDSADALESFSANDLELYFRRLPTPHEVLATNVYMDALGGYKLSVYQACDTPVGEYSVVVTNEYGQPVGGFSLPVGESSDQYLYYKFSIDSDGYLSSSSSRIARLPARVQDAEFVLRIDEEMDATFLGGAPYQESSLDEIPASEKIKCLLTENYGRGDSFWHYRYRSTGPEMMEKMLKGRGDNGFTDRSIVFYIGNRPVGIKEFTDYEGGENSYAQMATWQDLPNTPLLLQIVE